MNISTYEYMNAVSCLVRCLLCRADIRIGAILAGEVGGFGVEPVVFDAVGYFQYFVFKVIDHGGQGLELGFQRAVEEMQLR